MKEIPVLFNAEMVRAILDGRKTQTRRPFKVQPEYIGTIDGLETWNWNQWTWQYGKLKKLRIETVSPFGIVGDHLWVRETFCGYIQTSYEYDEWEEATTEKIKERFPMTVEYRATSKSRPYKWRPSIHMPRWASRITLKVTDIRVQRVQEISEEDAMAEGCEERLISGYMENGGVVSPDTFKAKEEFECLWNSIYNTWDANPWVWAATFEVVK